MSQRYLKPRTPAKRPVRPATKRPVTEREVWQRIDKRGRTSFVLRVTVIFGCILLSLTLLAELFIHRHASHLELAGDVFLCLTIGYIVGSFLWNRGQAMLERTSRTALRGR